MIADHAHDFDIAGEHFEFAADNAAAPELGYVAEALKWRCRDQG